jgi:hypothetical protein
MKTIVKILFLVLICGLSLTGYAQKEIDLPVNHRVILNFVDHVVYANIVTTDKKIKPNDDLYYFWYNANDIKKTRGGYDGKLLHGEYIEFYPNKNLKQKGDFKYGLKTGEWKTWYQSGEIASIAKWKNGKLNGNFRFFDEKGNLTKKGCYRNDAFHGTINTYLTESEIETCRYKKGIKRIKKAPFYKRWISKPVSAKPNSTNSEKKSNKMVKEKETTSDTKSIPAIQAEPEKGKKEPKVKKEKTSKIKKVKESKDVNAPDPVQTK